MKKAPVILPVETKVREYQGKLFLALQLLRRGHPVLFGEQARLWQYADLMSPGIYLDKSIASTHAKWSATCRGFGHRMVSLDEEGLIFFDADMYQKLRLDPRALEALDVFFAWGDEHRNAITDKEPRFRDKIVVCGNPRFDLLRPGLREVYRPKAEALKAKHGNILLVNTNFAFHNHFRSREDLRAMLAHYPLAEEPGYMDGWMDMHRIAHEAYMEMVPLLCARYPQHTVVLRPHPSESHAPWQELAATLPTLKVDGSGNVHEWILASETVIHFNCTTAVEAYFLGVQPIAYRPGRFPRYENHLPNALSENAFTLDELWTAVEGRFTARERGAVWTPQQAETARHYVAGMEGPTASEQIADKLSDLVHSPVRQPMHQRCVRELKRRWRVHLHKKREQRSPPDGYLQQKFPGISREEVLADLQAMSTQLDMPLRVSARAFAKNCVMLEPRV